MRIAQPTPSPDPTKTPDIAKTILHSVGDGILQAVTTTWWLGPFLGLALLLGTIRFVRGIIYPAGRTDPVRRFSGADRAVILTRAGNRCEYHVPLFGRCRRTKDLEADHIHPHSRGGQTSVANGQALCRVHNKQKRAKVPFNRSLAALAKRRATYFPSDHDPVVARFTRR